MFQKCLTFLILTPIIYAQSQAIVNELEFVPKAGPYPPFLPASHYPVLGPNQQNKFLWNNVADFIQSSNYFPIEVNVPDTFGSIYSGMSNIVSDIRQRLPFVNRFFNPNGNPRPNTDHIGPTTSNANTKWYLFVPYNRGEIPANFGTLNGEKYQPIQSVENRPSDLRIVLKDKNGNVLNVKNNETETTAGSGNTQNVPNKELGTSIGIKSGFPQFYFPPSGFFPIAPTDSRHQSWGNFIPYWKSSKTNAPVKEDKEEIVKMNSINPIKKDSVNASIEKIQNQLINETLITATDSTSNVKNPTRKVTSRPLLDRNGDRNKMRVNNTEKTYTDLSGSVTSMSAGTKIFSLFNSKPESSEGAVGVGQRPLTSTVTPTQLNRETTTPTPVSVTSSSLNNLIAHDKPKLNDKDLLRYLMNLQIQDEILRNQQKAILRHDNMAMEQLWRVQNGFVAPGGYGLYPVWV